MASHTWMGSTFTQVRSSLGEEFAKTAIVDIVEKTDGSFAKSFFGTEFGDIDPKDDYQIMIDQITGSDNVTIKMHRTAAKDTVTETEEATQFGPTMVRTLWDIIRPIKSPFLHVSAAVAVYLTFKADKACKIHMRVIRTEDRT